MGLAWAFAWSAVGALPRWVFGFNPDAPFPIIFGVFGFAAGVIFSGLLLLRERHRTFDEMSMPRFAGWGAVGGIALSALFARAVSLGLGDILAVAPTFAIAGAISAAGSLALARRATLLGRPARSDEALLAGRGNRALPGETPDDRGQ